MKHVMTVLVDFPENVVNKITLKMLSLSLKSKYHNQKYSCCLTAFKIIYLHIEK